MPSPDPAIKSPPTAVMTQWQALRQVGWIQNFDVIMGVLACFSIITLVFWLIFGHPTALNVIIAVLCGIFTLLVWAIMLIFRCSWFVLQMHADINLMPEAAARIVSGYFSAPGAATNRKT